ncbi:transketolase [Rhodococcus sp. NPDC049939]|uniref:transketolase n=1 Tax=Rhodococcus sp. NPDC049939 TaxID=3155511 RepID=UPI0033FA5A2B
MSITDDVNVLTRAVHPADWTDLDTKAVDTIRVLAADAVQKAGNGHPGTAMSLAPLAYTLFQRVMRHDPADPDWIGRDRFVLSCGHSSLTLYIQLYLAGYGLELEDLESLRTWGSKTPGHPEYGHTRGVEITTGPLGQGLASAVGMAMAARRERGLFDPEPALGESPFDHHIYVIGSDGDIEEGVTSEASSIAGVQQLGNLTLIYDDNKISIEDDTSIAMSEDTAARYEAYGWHVQIVEGGENVVAIEEALRKAREVTDRPSMILLRTIIAYPAPNKMNTGASHGAALGVDEVAAVKRALGFDPDKTFEVADEVIAHTRKVVERGAQAHKQWQKSFDDWAGRAPENKKLLDRLLGHDLPAGWADGLPSWEPDPKGIATRKASAAVLNAIGPVLPELWGGSADLAESNNTTIKGADSFGPTSISTRMWNAQPYGRTLHFGVREHAMGAILNGIALHGPTRPYGGTFLVFSDYMRPAVRLAAIMKTAVTYVWTHDSIGLGEDGPTHQPIEHLAALRAIPGLYVVRPGDANETAHAWRAVLEKSADEATRAPAGLALTRQDLPVLEGTNYEGVSRGGYILAEASSGAPEVVLIGTGSELQLAVAAREALESEGVPTRVVSMPCVEWFDAQDQAYRDGVLPPTVKARVAVEAGVSMPWHRFVGSDGEIVSIEHYGASADYKTLFREFGFTPEAVTAAAQRSLARVKG